MKTIYKLISAIGVFAMFVGCFSDLDLSPIDSETPEVFFKDSLSCEQGLVGCYDAMNKYNGNLFNGSVNSLFVIWNITDEMYNNAAGTGPKLYSYSASYATNQSMYRQLYEAIQRCSQLIKALNYTTMEESARTVIEGEARFLRAFCYFTLVQNWGRVPLITEAVTSVNNPYVKQAEEADIYDWVINEMTDAEKMVRPITDFGHGGRVNKSAVRAMLARVCLFKAGFPCYDESKYTEAYQWAKKVIDDPVHELIPNYAEVFIPLIQDKYDIRENLWEMESYFVSKTDGRTEYTPSLSVTLGTNCSKSEPYSFSVNNTIYVRKRMFDYYEPDTQAIFGSPDERRNWNIAPYKPAAAALDCASSDKRLVLTYHDYKANSTDKLIYDRQINKFNRQYALIVPAYDSNAGTNLCMIRYADVLLMAAEALCMMNGGPNAEAIDYVNLVRKRAYGQLDGRKFIDHIEVTNPGKGYVKAKVCVEITDPANGSQSITCTTSETNAAKAYITGNVEGAPTIAAATVGTSGDITEVVMKDSGHAYSGVPQVTIRNIYGTTSGTGATAVAVMRDFDDYKLPASATASKEAFMQTIMDERARELCFEGWRREDLKRWHNLVDVLQATRDDGRNATGITGAQLEYIMIAGNNVNEAHYYLPIPSSEIMLNRELVQNPGW